MYHNIISPLSHGRIAFASSCLRDLDGIKSHHLSDLALSAASRYHPVYLNETAWIQDMQSFAKLCVLRLNASKNSLIRLEGRLKDLKFWPRGC